MEIPDPLAYFLILSTIGSFIFSTILFFDKYHPKIRILPWRKISRSISSIFYIFGGIYLIFFSFVAAYLFMELVNPEKSLFAKLISIEFSHLFALITVFLLMGFLWFLGGLEMLVGVLKFLKATELAPRRANDIALKLIKAQIFKKNFI